ncbi:MAG: site-specific integrase [Betaproteobacteria bacterium]
MSTLTQAAIGITARLRSLADRPQSLTVYELIERYMAAYAGRDGAMRHRLLAWQTLIGEFTLENVDSDLIHAARNELQTLSALAYKGVDHAGNKIFKAKSRHRSKAGGTINRYISCLGSVCTWGIEQRLTPRAWVHPCRGIKRMPGEREIVRFLDDGERDRLLAACKVAQYPRLYSLVLMAMLSGARRGELLQLTWQDVDLAAGIARLGRTKNGDRRTLVLLPQVVEALRPFHTTDGNRYVFGSKQSRCQKPASVDTAWRKAIIRADVKNFRFHDLRHCCASYLAQAGVSLNVIADILGHRKMDMTRRYAHLTTQNKASAMLGALGKIGIGDHEEKS